VIQQAVNICGVVVVLSVALGMTGVLLMFTVLPEPNSILANVLQYASTGLLGISGLGMLGLLTFGLTQALGGKG